MGYSLRYFVDNEFEVSPVGLAGPAQWFPLWFSAAGFAYVCPQEVAYRRIQSDGRVADYWTDLLPEYLPDAWLAALDVLERCRTLGSHVVYIDAESQADADDLAFYSRTPGVIVAFRNQSPQASTFTVSEVLRPKTMR